MRAYHRLDPLMDERKSHYSPAELGTFVKVQLLAGRQTNRGRFRSVQAIRGALPAAYVKHLPVLFREGDLTVNDDGTVYLEGWDEWQEGDLTVADRMAALRNRRRNAAVTGTVTPTVTRPSPTANANAIANASLDGEGSGEGLPNLDDQAVTFLEGVTGRTVRQAGDRNLAEYDRQIGDHGLTRVVSAYRKALKALPSSPKPTARQLIWSARNILEPFADPKAAMALDSEDDARKRSERVLSSMQARRVEMYRNTGKWDPAWGEPPESAA